MVEDFIELWEIGLSICISCEAVVSSVWLEYSTPKLILFFMVLKTGRRYEATVWEVSQQCFDVRNACKRSHVLEAREWILKLLHIFFSHFWC